MRIRHILSPERPRTKYILAALVVCAVAALAVAAVMRRSACRPAPPEFLNPVQLDLLAARTDKLRKSDCRLSVLDAGGRPLPGVKVRVAQTRGLFPFGCGLPSPDELAANHTPAQLADYRARFSRLFNYATTTNAFKWAEMEPERGRFNWKQADDLIAWAGANGIRVKGHTLLYATPQGRPAWAAGLDDAELEKAILSYVDAVTRRYAGRVYAWEAVNEPVHYPYYLDRLPGIDAKVIALIKANDPAALVTINDFNLVEFPQYLSAASDADAFIAYAQGLRSRSPVAPVATAPSVDAVGIQAHYGRWYQYDELDATFRKFSAAGLPVHITELIYESGGMPIYAGTPEAFFGMAARADQSIGRARGRAAWTEEAQARAYEEFYRIAFAQKEVEAITIWDFADGTCWSGAGGILRADFSEKPSYKALDRLINGEWRTRAALVTDAAGRVNFRGFYGRYQISLDGRASGRFDLELAPGGPTDFVLTAPEM